MADAETQPGTPFDRIGGAPAISRVVDRFYDLMEQDRSYAALRAMHADDLTPMRASLSDFLAAWMGGPRTWFEERPGACIMSIHAGLGVTRETAEQWIDAMSRAIADTVTDDLPFVEAMTAALANISMGMARR